MAMTSQQRYELMLEQDRLGVNTGKDQRLLAAINAGEISIEEALPPITSSGNPMMTFGGSNLSSSPLSSSSTSPNVAPVAFNDPRISTTSRRPTDPVDPTTVLATGGILTLPAAQPNLPATKVVDTGLANRPLTSDQLAIQQQAQAAAEAQAAEEAAMNQAFLQMLYNLGLSNLYNNLFTNFQQQQAAVPALPTQGMLGKPQFGVAPVRRGYLPPQVVPQSSIAQDTGLLQYILNQGQ